VYYYYLPHPPFLNPDNKRYTPEHNLLPSTHIVIHTKSFICVDMFEISNLKKEKKKRTKRKKERIYYFFRNNIFFLT